MAVNLFILPFGYVTYKTTINGCKFAKVTVILFGTKKICLKW